jgi:hypothetical protein
VTATVRVVLGDISGCPDSPVVEAMTDTDILISWKTPISLNHAPIIAYKVQMGYIGKKRSLSIRNVLKVEVEAILKNFLAEI